MLKKRRHPHKSNVLLVNITRLGDILQATPTIAGIKMENPECKVTVLVEKQFGDICYYMPDIDEVYTLDLGMTVRSITRGGEGLIDAYEYIDEVVQDLKQRGFDYALNMSSSAYTALLLKLLNINRLGGWSSDEEGYRVIESDWARLFATSVFHRNRFFNSLNLVDMFRCSADVELHPLQLKVAVNKEEEEKAAALLREAQFSNQGPLIAIHCGASQTKRQWGLPRFVALTKLLLNELSARVILTGSKKEAPFVALIAEEVKDKNVFVSAGKTSVPTLAALLKECDILVCGDTGPMHLSVAVGTPVISLFLASAYGYETGPYSEGNIVLQPVVSCGPCNPNKPCAKPICHECITPQLITSLIKIKLRGDINSLPKDFVPQDQLIIYSTIFDKWGFYDMKPLTSTASDPYINLRYSYRAMWLDDIGGIIDNDLLQAAEAEGSKKKLNILSSIEGIEELIEWAKRGQDLIVKLIKLIKDERSPAYLLKEVNTALADCDKKIEYLGYKYEWLGPLSRMFLFAKEALSGSDPLSLASQMGEAYRTLERRSKKLIKYYSIISKEGVRL
ncbi:MAG: glycosyltransferase family 9 protein [Candidatus Dadabacteria bacterium]|nr:MAG: glycosyltransferase family 9 protein [Candidatus Dadabacteria bacterium]